MRKWHCFFSCYWCTRTLGRHKLCLAGQGVPEIESLLRRLQWSALNGKHSGVVWSWTVIQRFQISVSTQNCLQVFCAYRLKFSSPLADQKPALLHGTESSLGCMVPLLTRIVMITITVQVNVWKIWVCRHHVFHYSSDVVVSIVGWWPGQLPTWPTP